MKRRERGGRGQTEDQVPERLREGVRARADHARARGGRRRLQHASGDRPAGAGRGARRPRETDGQDPTGTGRTVPQDGARLRAAGGARRRHDRVVRVGGPPVFTTDGTATYVLDDLTGERHEGTAEDLRAAMRLFDALPEVDFVWPSVYPRDCDPVTAGLDMSSISLMACSKHVQDEVRTPDLVPPLLEITRGHRGGPGEGATDLLRHQLHDRAADARRPHDRGEHRSGPRRRAAVHPADGPHGHDGADDGAGHVHPQHGRGTVGGRPLPARQPGLPAGRRDRFRRRRDAQRSLPLRHARGRADQPALRRDGAFLRSADPGKRHRQRRQGRQRPGRRRGGHDRRAGGARRSSTASSRSVSSTAPRC